MKKTLKLGKYDAELDTDVCDRRNNANLTLILRLGFRQINPAASAASGTYNDYGDASKTARKIIKWTGPEWASWKSNFVASAQRYWNAKFWVINNDGAFAFEDSKQIYIPNFFCRFKLLGSDATVGSHHHTIDVVRLDPTETWFGSHSTLYDSLDTKSVQKGTDSGGKAIMQQAHVHEVGHLLGLGHVDIGKVHCPASGNTNASACYGIADADKNSVMGQGMQLRLSHASPWVDAANGFIKAEPPSTVYTRPTPMLPRPQEAKLSRHYPRTPAEFTTNKLITKR
jgi:hypothetical protein